jgi:hypothetical protein
LGAAGGAAARLVFPGPISYNRAMPDTAFDTAATRPDADILILGAGPAGMLCALTAARRGRSPLLVDQGRETGRKLRASGGGRCNCTNRNAAPAHYLSQDPRFTAQALSRYAPAQFLAFLRELGLSAHEEDQGKRFCDQGAQALCAALEKACRAAGCRFLLGRAVTAAARPEQADRDAGGGLFRVDTDRGPLYAPRVVLALGSPAWPALGGTDIVARLAGQLDLPHVPARPALTPFELSGPALALCRELAGLSVTARLTLPDGTACADGLLFTHQGLSGPAALQISSHWRRGEALRVDLAPDQDVPALLRAPEHSRRQARTAIAALLPRRLAEARLAELPQALAERRLAELSRAELEIVARLVTHWSITPKGTAGMARAEAASGGLHTGAFSPKTMQCRTLPGLFAIGEALDVAGELGGYNLHWAWASGFAAGQAL